jgi:hypothetical protein
MNKFLLLSFFIFNTAIGFSQNFTGQWKGEFVDNSSIVSWGSNRCDYVIDLDVKGTEVTGYSYTYFTDNGKKYYTICRLVGFVDKRRKYVEVRETARTKTNVPDNVTNSFQIHKLNWRTEGGNEILEGKWIPAPGQDKTNTGFGTTLLSKRQLSEISPLAKKLNSKKDPNNSLEKALVGAPKPKSTIAKLPTKPTQPIAKVTPKITPKPIAKTNTKPIAKLPIVLTKKDTTTKPNTSIAKVILPKEKIVPVGFEKRSNNILQTVNVENPIVKIELYDNGDIDGDSVSLFYNGKVLLAHKKLTTQPITLDLPVNNDEVNELVMYADNLGTIPPNTALMIVTDGNKRYEVRVTSDLKKSGTIRFVHNKKE